MMEHKCHFCNKTYSRKWTLIRHLESLHGSQDEDSRKLSTIQSTPVPPFNQIGGGWGTASEEAEEGSEEAEEDITSNDTEEDDDEDEDEDDDENDDIRDTDPKHDDSVFDQFMFSFDNDTLLTDRENIFRNRFANYLVLHSNMRKHHVFKKVMETVRQIRDDPADYGYEEALRLAVEQRQFLLNTLVDVPMTDDDASGDADDEEDDDQYSVLS